MDVTNLIFLIEKHHHRRNKKGRVIKARRAFRSHTPEGLDACKMLAGKYAAERDEDFLIVQVVAEVSRPGAASLPVSTEAPARPEPVRGCAHQKARVLASGSGVMVLRCQSECQAFVVQYWKGGQVAEWTMKELGEVLDGYLPIFSTKGDEDITTKSHEGKVMA